MKYFCVTSLIFEYFKLFFWKRVFFTFLFLWMLTSTYIVVVRELKLLQQDFFMLKQSFAAWCCACLIKKKLAPVLNPKDEDMSRFLLILLKQTHLCTIFWVVPLPHYVILANPFRYAASGAYGAIWHPKYRHPL